jgi:hypothetical protein
MIPIRNRLPTLLLTVLALGCRERPQAPIEAAEWQHHCMDALSAVVVHDIFSPPVASRIYAYTSLAYHEALRFDQPDSLSLLTTLKGFHRPALPKCPDSLDARLAASIAFLRVSRALVFSKDSLSALASETEEQVGRLPSAVRSCTQAWGEAVAAAVLKRAGADNYRQTRSMPRYSVFDEPGKWRQTPPDYSDATEPHWRLIRPLRMDSASQCAPPPPPAYDLRPGSRYERELREVWETSRTRTPDMDTIARFWDDNPFVSEHVGHLTYATKKLTPVGHWMGIVRILCRQAHSDARATALAYALTSAAVFDGFISCWDEKYRSRTVRPVTVIREQYDATWSPLLQTPSFPEYTSGHSVITAAAATVLSHLFGSGVGFEDTTELPYLGLRRSFPSIEAAADEAGISRLYGGIHFRAAIENGKQQGRSVGSLFLPLTGEYPPATGGQTSEIPAQR